MVTRSLCKIKLMQNAVGESAVHAGSLCHGELLFSTDVLHAQQIHVTITNKRDTFCLVRLGLHIFATRTPNSSVLYSRGKAQNYTIYLVTLDKMEKNTSSLRFMDIWNNF